MGIGRKPQRHDAIWIAWWPTEKFSASKVIGCWPAGIGPQGKPQNNRGWVATFQIKAAFACQSGRLCGDFSTRATERVERDVKVAEDGKEERVMDADAVGEQALKFRNDGAAHDCGNQ